TNILRHAGGCADLRTKLGGVRNLLRLLPWRGNERKHLRATEVLAQLDGSDHATIDEIDLGDRTAELAGKKSELAVDGEVGMVDAPTLRRCDRILQAHGARIAEVETFVRFRDHNGGLTVRRP